MSVPGGAAVLRQSLRKSTRIIAIPLSRPLPRPSTLKNPQIPGGSLPQSSSGSGHGPGALTYYHFQLSTKKKRKEKEKSQQPEEGAKLDGEHAKSKSRWSLPEGGISAWVQNKAAETWAGFGKAEGGWKLYVFRMGERIVDRMEFEELALKSIDPSLGPTITHPRSSEIDSEQRQEAVEKEKAGVGSGTAAVRIPLVYPPSALTSQLAVSELRMYVQHRIPVHRKGFFLWMFVAPLTAPFMIIPVIPNLPFFFCVWRSWSHYKAYRASRYLETLLDKGAIVPESSEDLDAVYSEFASPPASPSSPSPSPSPSSSGPSTSTSAAQDAPSTQSSGAEAPPQHQLLLTKDAIPALVERFELGSHAKADLYRAFEQVRLRVYGEGKESR